MYKILATDIDGTLFTDDKKITEKTRRAIKKCADMGVYVILSSGRYYKGVLPIAESLGLSESYHVADNGICYFNTEGEAEFIKVFDKDEYKVLIEHLRKTCKSFVVTNETGMWYETDDRRCVETMLPNNGEAHYIKMKDILDVPNPFKICAYYETDEERDNILSREYEKISGCVSFKVLIDFYPKGVDKYETLLEVAKKLNVKEEEILAVGDSDNDLPMIENARLGVSVKNASENLKNASDIVLTQSNNEDPLCYVIENIIERTLYTGMF